VSSSSATPGLTLAQVTVILSTSGRNMLITGSTIQVPVQVQGALATAVVAVSPPGVSYNFATATGTVKAGNGTLYAMVVGGPGPGTVWALANGATVAAVTVPAGNSVPAAFGPGVAFTGPLVASVSGTLNVTTVYQ